MNTKSLRKGAKFGILGVFLGILIFQSALQTQTPSFINKTSFEEPFLDDLTSPQSEGSYDLLNLPFFENSTPIVDWLENNITDDATLPESPLKSSLPLYYAESNRNGSDIIDDNHYLEDIAVFMDGFIDLIFENASDMLDYIDRLAELGFKNTTENGYFSYVNNGCTDNSTIYELKGNAQIIISLLNNIKSGKYTVSQVKPIITNQWNVLNNLFWDEEIGAYNHSSVDSEKYMEDQFLVAIIGFLIDQTNVGVSGALERAQDLMEMMFDDYYDFATFDTSETVNSRLLSTNAYAIWALSEWELSEPASYTPIETAEEVYEKLTNDFLNSSTYALYMLRTDNGGSNVHDENITLKENAIMLLAVERLFEVTGNFSYFERCMEMYNSIEENLRDPLYGNYYKSITPQSIPSTNTVKNFGSNAHFLRTLNVLNDNAAKSQLNLAINSTEDEIMMGEVLYLNISANFKMNIEDSNEEAIYIKNSSFFLTIHNDEGELEYNASFSTNNTGSVFSIFGIENLTIGTYTISLYANYTGLTTRFATESFIIISGLSIIDSHFESDNLFAGSDVEFNLSIESIRTTDISVIINVNSSDIVNFTQSIEITADDVEYIPIISISILADAKFSSSSLFIEVVHDSEILLTKTITFTIESPIDVKEISHKSNSFPGTNYVIDFVFENMIESSQDIQIAISGEHLTHTMQQTNVTKGLNSFSSIISISENAPYGDLSYNINVSRKSDGEIIFIADYNLNIRPSVEFRYINVPDFSYHGQESVVQCGVYSYLDTSQDIVIIIDGVLMSPNTTIIPGESQIQFSIGKKFMNPYNFGIQTFLVEIEDSNGNLLYEQYISTQLKPTFGSIALAYILPMVIPLIAIVALRQIAMENKKRLS